MLSHYTVLFYFIFFQRKFASYSQQHGPRYLRVFSRDILVGELQQFTWNKINGLEKFRTISFLSIQVTRAKPWRQIYHYNLAVQTLPPAVSTGVLRGRTGRKVKKQSARGAREEDAVLQCRNLSTDWNGFFVTRHENIHRPKQGGTRQVDTEPWAVKC